MPIIIVIIVIIVIIIIIVKIIIIIIIIIIYTRKFTSITDSLVARRPRVAWPLISSWIAEYLQDLHVYDPAAASWMDLSAAVGGSPPPARFGHGFASAGGRLYVFGGLGPGGAFWSY